MKSWRKSHSLPLFTGEYFITGWIIIADYNGHVLMKHIPAHLSYTERNLQRDSGPSSLLIISRRHEMPDKEFPFILTTGRISFHYHTGTMSRRTSTLNREYPECLMEINPKDADSLNIRPMDMVRVSSRRGDNNGQGICNRQYSSGCCFHTFSLQRSCGKSSHKSRH